MAKVKNPIGNEIEAATAQIVEFFVRNPAHDQTITPLFPTVYRATHFARYLETCKEGQALVVGMNPGPHGMGQTGLAFVDLPIQRRMFPDDPGTPADLTGTRHRAQDDRFPPVSIGRWKYHRGLGDQWEDSAGRMWRGLVAALNHSFPLTHEAAGLLMGTGKGSRAVGPCAAIVGVMDRVLMLNALPILYLDRDGNNVSFSDKARRVKATADHRDAIDRYLRRVCAALHPSALIGVGDWAYSRVASLGGAVKILHPSPATGKSESAWAAEAVPKLREALAKR